MVETPLAPVRQTLYPTKDNLSVCITELNSQLPITNSNDLKAALMTYHNTLLNEIDKGTQTHATQ